MSEFKVPVAEVAAAICTADGAQRAGRVFAPLTATDPPTPVRATEWLAGAGHFFPFLQDGDPRPGLLNREQVAVVTMAGDLEPDLHVGAASCRVVVTAAQARWTGDLTLEAGEGRRRVADVVNRPEPFLILRDAGRVHLVRKTCITTIVEEEPRVA